jgi:hypothetical protein
MPVLGRCGGCRFFLANLDPKAPHVDGFCRANPPQTIVHPDNRGQVVLRTQFPMVKRGEWCGLHQTDDVEETTQ